MAEEKKKGGDISLTSTGMLALALAVFGLIWTGPSPLIDERPPGQMESGSDKGKIQDIDARMWQDPLGTVMKEVKRTSSQQRSVQLQSVGNKLTLVVKEEKSTEKSTHSPEKTIHRSFVGNQAGRIYMLAVMLPGGPYPEAEEGRRRKRYAVLSALATLGFAPVETEHIGYFIPKSDEQDNSASLELPDAVPFEFFEREQNNKQQITLVLWLDSGHFNKNIEKKINRIFDQAIPDNIDEQIFRRAVIGPNTSNQLKMLIEESKENVLSAPFFAAGATVAPLLLPQNGKTGNKLLRTIGNDQDISKALVGELKLRQINPKKDHVLLISEWDTLYGRSLPETFAKEYGGVKAKCLPMVTRINQNSNEDTESNVHCVNYMRGIDGKLPGSSGKTDSAPDASVKSEAVQFNSNIDRPSGNNQKDYLRRLADQARKFDASIRNNSIPNLVKNNGISAIGVLGSDVYDKLMILQALRPFFPGKIFFTTDLDAAYFSPSELRYTHNLIIGSSFGLSLAPELQKSIPPFRDSYQTAAFFSTKLAISQDEFINDGIQQKLTGHNATKQNETGQNGWLSEPRIFEIGRKGAIDLSKEYLLRNSDKCAEHLSTCSYIHPDPDNNLGKDVSIPVLALWGISLLSGFILLYRMSWTSRWLPANIKDLISKIQPRHPSTNSNGAPLNSGGKWKTAWNLIKPWALQRIAGAIEVLPLVVVCASVVGIVYSILLSIGKDEPFYLWNGISIWPSNLLVFFALIISFWLYRHSRDQLEGSDQKLEADFNLELNDKDKPIQTGWPLTVHGWENKIDGEHIQVNQLWLDYKNYGNRSARFARTAINTFIFTLFGMTAVMLSGGLPVPARGNSFYIDVFLEMTCVLVVVFLIMWVVDAARLFSKFIEHLAYNKESNWSEECVKRWGLGWPKEHVMYWIDLQFVAQHTKAMEKFIWYPVPPLLLTGLARSSFFDNWTFSAGLLASVAVLLLYLFSIAFFLQYGANDMRAKAVRQLGGELMELHGKCGSNENEITKLEKMIDEIKRIDEGAFTPFMRQPMVQALLTFLSGSGGLIVLMDHFF